MTTLVASNDVLVSSSQGGTGTTSSKRRTSLTECSELHTHSGTSSARRSTTSLSEPARPAAKKMEYETHGNNHSNNSNYSNNNYNLIDTPPLEPTPPTLPTVVSPSSSPLSMLPLTAALHSDFTVPTSNRAITTITMALQNNNSNNNHGSLSPPHNLSLHHHHEPQTDSDLDTDSNSSNNSNNSNNNHHGLPWQLPLTTRNTTTDFHHQQQQQTSSTSTSSSRRAIFGNTVQRKYAVQDAAVTADANANTSGSGAGVGLLWQHAEQQPPINWLVLQQQQQQASSDVSSHHPLLYDAQQQHHLPSQRSDVDTSLLSEDYSVWNHNGNHNHNQLYIDDEHDYHNAEDVSLLHDHHISNNNSNNNHQGTSFVPIMAEMNAWPSTATATATTTAAKAGNSNNNPGHRDDNDSDNNTHATMMTTAAATTYDTMGHDNNNNKHTTSTTTTTAKTTTKQRPHETLHAQSLLLGLAFAAVWTPSNLMAPNLTEMATDFGFTNAAERDLYLGSYCALAMGVLSFPIGAGIGILADLCSRQRLFVATVAGGAIAAAMTGLCQQYWQLFLMRLLSGGFMSGSVTVVFSFLGDLFTVEDRNAASSGLTAMMGLGIIMGQVYAGTVGATMGWQHAFYTSGLWTFILSMMCLCLIQEPERGGKERVLQDMIKAGTCYDRRLSWQAFVHAMHNNTSNRIMLAQGFVSSLPWGIIFVFLNDYLSQEMGFTVQDATFLVLIFGIGCAAGGIVGGYFGQWCMVRNRAWLPAFMAITTAVGIIPFIGLLNLPLHHARGIPAITFSLMGGLIASLPSVNVRPCIINVNPPETRGAALTASNLMINLGRGFGPSCVTVMVSTFPHHVNRQFAFNVTLTAFWLISAIFLFMLMRTLPQDQDAMEEELALYAKNVIEARQNLHNAAATATATAAATGSVSTGGGSVGSGLLLPEDDIISIEERMMSFDGTAARQTFMYMSEGLKELRQEFKGKKLLPRCSCGTVDSCSSSSSSSQNNSSHDIHAERKNGSHHDNNCGVVTLNGDQRRQRWQQEQQLHAPAEEQGKQTALNDASSILSVLMIPSAGSTVDNPHRNNINMNNNNVSWSGLEKPVARYATETTQLIV